MDWLRYTRNLGFVLALASVFASSPASAGAPNQITVHFNGTPIVFKELVPQAGSRAIAIDDPGLQDFLARIGAVVTWQPGERYVLVTTAQPVVISFSIGDMRYDVGPVSENGPFAPFLGQDGRPYLPLLDLIHALGFDLKRDGAALVLQPQLTSLEVETTADGAKVLARAGTPLTGHVTVDQPEKVAVIFDGVGTTLGAVLPTAGGNIARVLIHSMGTVTHPTTEIVIYLSEPIIHERPATDDNRDFYLLLKTASRVAVATPSPLPSVTPPNTVAMPTATATAESSSAPQEPVEPQSVPSPGREPVSVGPIDSTMHGSTFNVRISVSGSATFEWHRLRAPDNRFWLDIHNARLAIPPVDEPGTGAVLSLRAHQEDPHTVRIALSPSGFNSIGVSADATGIVVIVKPQLADESVARSGSGLTGSQSAAGLVSPGASSSPGPASSGYVARNPRLIVIDPGHGGSDPGTVAGTLLEKDLTLQISRRVKDVLTARGWQVMMTRTDDRDVGTPYDDLGEEGGARDAIANSNGARIFLSIHVNGYMNAGPHGATVFYYKSEDLALAHAIDKRILSELTMQNDGVQKGKYYVIHHADMPAALVETAFMTNPFDRVLLLSPQWQQKMAEAIADGVEDYIKSTPVDNAVGDQ